MPCTWPAPGFPQYHLDQYLRIGPLSAYNSDALTIDGNTGTQLDVPPHSIPHPDTNLPNAGPYGRVYTDKVPAWQFCGEACVIDCRDLCDGKVNGRSELVTKERVAAWEQQHRPLGPGDVVLFYSGYSDKYYRPLPEGRRFCADPVEGRAPAWPDPDPACMEYLAERKVMALGTDSASMGPLPDLAEPTHIAGLKHGMIWAESLTGFGARCPRPARFIACSVPSMPAILTPAPALAIVDPELSPRLIAAARKKQVADLSVVLSSDLPTTWTGRGAGNHRQPYLRVPLFFAANLGAYHVTHMLNAHAGTHLVPPSYALPTGLENTTYPATVQDWLAEYEADFGPRGSSQVTAEQVSLAETCGPLRVIDVRSLIGTTPPASWPRSPEITEQHVAEYERSHGPLQPGDVVVFRSGYSDAWYKSLPAGLACIDAPLNGKREGWPAPGPRVLAHLHAKGIRCVGTDGVSLGGTEPKRALMTYWMLGTKGMVAVEFLTGLGNLPDKGAYFLFAAQKIQACHGGPGRALAVY